jgi:hypothetical protein
MARSLRARPFTLALLLVPALASAGSIYLNGVNIDGVAGVKFEKATVRIDENGNIFIDAPGYAAKVVSADGMAPQQPSTQQQQPQQQVAQPVLTQPVMMGMNGTPVVAVPLTSLQTTTPAAKTPEQPKKITKRYFLVATQNAPGMPEYEMDVYVNAKYLLTLKSTLDQEVIDITRNLVLGGNTITIEAKKVTVGPRKSFSMEHVFNVVVGEGNEAQGNVMIDNPVVTFRRTAADNDSVSKDFNFTTR